MMFDDVGQSESEMMVVEGGGDGVESMGEGGG